MIRIDPEFEREARPLGGDELVELERSLLAEGCRDPLVVSTDPDEGDHVLIDGHHRYRLCHEHGIDYALVEVDPRQSLGEPGMDWRDAVLIWINRNQRSRRNLNDLQWKRSVGREYNLRKRALGENQHTRVRQPDEPSGATNELLAEEYGLAPRTVERYGDMDAALDEIEAENPSLAAKITDDGSKWHPRQIVEFAKSEHRDEMARALATGEAKTYPEAKEKAGIAHVAHNSGNNEWYTPREYLDAARQVMGAIDLDPASSETANATVEAEAFYTAEEDGLKQPWHGCVWLNPPYAQPLIGQFCDRVTDAIESDEIEQAVVLVNNGTETRWGQRLLTACDAVCFPEGRIKFLDPEGNPSGAPLQGQMVVYFGRNIEAFVEAFGRLGACFTC